MKVKFRKFLISSVASVALMATWTPAVPAKTAPAPANSSNVNALGDIVVTASKQSGSAQRLPAAVTVMGGETLKQRGVSDLLGIQNLMPSAKLNYESSVIQVFIRGIGSQLDQPYIPVSVGFNLNGASVCRYCAGGSLYDVRRVEVLPGPQGTLYGSSAIGGVVNIISNQPTHEWTTDATIEYGNHNTRHETLVQNVPVTANLSFRVAADFNDNDGFFNNGTYDHHSRAARLSSLYTSGNFSAFLTASFYRNRYRPAPVQYTPYPAGGAYNFPETEVATAFFYPPNGLSFGYGNALTKSSIFTGQFDKTLGNVTFSYIPAYIHASVEGDRNLSGFKATTHATVKQYSNELRVNSNVGKVSWIAGLFQLWNHSTYDVVFGPNLSGVDVNSINKSYAAYGQLTYSVNDSTRLTIGARYGTDYLEAPRAAVIFPTAGFGRGTLPFTYNNSWSKFQWKVSAEHDLTPKSMLYANVQTGFNPGTFRTAAALRGTTVEPQTMLGYTVGSKNLFLDGQLRFNVEAFYYQYKNLFVNSLNYTTGIQSTNNAPETHIKGVQADMEATLGSHLHVNAALGYLDAKFANFSIGPVNYAGYQIPFSPKFTATLGAQYTYKLRSAGSVRVGVNSYISDSYWSIFSHTSDLYQRAYTKTDVNITYFLPGGRWDVGGYARNLENVATQGASAETGRPYPNAGAVYLDAPREYGLKLHATF
jgi:iron complex outermembrane receptor protein